MTSAPQPDPDPHRATDAGSAGAGNDRQGRRGELRLVSGRLGDRCGSAPGRRLRVAPAVQLELVCGREGPRPEVVWASLPERSREAVLVLLARLIGSGAVEEEEGVDR